MLNFLKDLSTFTQAFGNIDPSMFTAGNGAPSQKEETKADHQTAQEQKKQKTDEKNPQSPTVGIADEFIQNILDSYLSKSGNNKPC